MEASNETLQYLPPEVITNILLRLPVESLLRFKRVCKTWCSEISTPHFSKTHVNISRNSTNYANHALIYGSDEGVYSFSLPCIMDIMNADVIPIPKPFSHPCSGIHCSVNTIYGNSNGLLLLFDDERLVLYNPATRKLRRIPDSGIDDTYVAYGLCYHELDNDYRVVELHRNEDFVYVVSIYSLRTNSWRKIDDGFHLPDYDWDVDLVVGMPVGGVLHWKIRYSLCQVFVVDTVTYTHGTLAAPKYEIRDVGDDVGDDVEWDVMNFGGYLGVYHSYLETRFDIWMMKGSWTKVLSLTYHHGYRGWIYPLFGLKDGEILVHNRSEYSIINSRENSSIWRVIWDLDGTCMLPSVYIESLVSPSLDGE